MHPNTQGYFFLDFMPDGSTSGVPLQYNPLHNIESAFWVTLQCLSTTVPDNKVKYESDDPQKKCIEFAETVFTKKESVVICGTEQKDFGNMTRSSGRYIHEHIISHLLKLKKDRTPIRFDVADVDKVVGENVKRPLPSIPGDSAMVHLHIPPHTPLSWAPGLSLILLYISSLPSLKVQTFFFHECNGGHIYSTTGQNILLLKR
ncbi:hypothetical protein BDQ17DRAFT_1330838 [Cyathus striatus]|nr:hypothetical protein BDQ17DRAFT_1330838 [Cyathus striatus]